MCFTGEHVKEESQSVRNGEAPTGERNFFCPFTEFNCVSRCIIRINPKLIPTNG